MAFNLKRGQIKRSKRADLSLESIVKLVIIAICLLIAVYVGYSIYKFLAGTPQEGTAQTFKTFIQTANSIGDKQTMARAFYVDPKHSIIAFNAEEDHVQHEMGSCINNGNTKRPDKAKKGGCADMSKACICICGRHALSCGDNQCEADTAFECKYLTNITRVIASEHLPGDNENFDEYYKITKGGKVRSKIGWGEKTAAEDGRYFVYFGNPGLASANTAESVYFTKKGDTLYITYDKP